MKKRRLDYNLKETTHSSFSLMGYFSSFPKFSKIIKGSVGTLNYHDGIAEVEISPEISYKGDNNEAHLRVDNEKDALIYGYLEDGTYVRFNVFHSVYSVNHMPGFTFVRYIVYDLDFSKNEFTSDNCSIYDHVLITYDSLNKFGAFVLPKLSNLIDSSVEENSPVLIGKDEDFDISLTYEWEKYGDTSDINIKSQIELELKIKGERTKITSFINNFANFLSIINNSRINITSIRLFDKDNNILQTHLFVGPHTKQNGRKDYSYGICSEFNFVNYEDKLGKITDFISTISLKERFNKLVENYLYNIDGELDFDSAIINYVNSIDIYMKGQKYHNGKKIENLSKKITFWLRQFPSDLYGLYFDKSQQISQDNNRDYFIKALVDTRDYLTHFDKRESPYLISDSERFKYITQLRELIHIYILHMYGIPDQYIEGYYKRHRINRIS